ncbi:acyltransferase family protein [Brevundimonas variabilis]|uniref:Putative membrane protein n=1 Tax=Brevundimonas variabilis TaxID=74312 RepID=A0A7W9FEF4_9CAUL|nr:acyltransferase family protein [Brevundimonas variabilis]MBB5744478.1 putative membrane protein [Brevundimonas variabilis]
MSSTAPVPAPSSRRHDLDWIRVGAFFLLIFYHVGMLYVSWDFHVKSPRIVEAVQPVMMLTNPWRLTLLFLVSGAATRFMADRFAADGGRPGARLAGSRVLRLAPALVFGMLVIVPPQSYFEIWHGLAALGVADPAASPVLHDFWIRYATGSGAWCDAEGCLTTPTWNHLWFIAYLLPYGLIVAALIALAGPALKGLERRMETVLSGWGLLIWPVLWFAVLRFTLAPLFEITHALTYDWYNHALSFSAYLFGFLTARSEIMKAAYVRLRRPALVLAILSWAGWATYAWIYRADGAVPPDALRLAMRMVYAVNQWTCMAAILGFAARHLTRGGPVLRYLSVGVFPFYIVHQTIIIAAAHWLMPLSLPLATEAIAILGVTLACCWLTYEIARRLGWLGLFLGVKARSPKKRSPA